MAPMRSRQVWRLADLPQGILDMDIPRVTWTQQYSTLNSLTQSRQSIVNMTQSAIPGDLRGSQRARSTSLQASESDLWSG